MALLETKRRRGGRRKRGKREEEEGEVARTLRPVQSHTAQFNIQIRESKHHFFLEHTSLFFSNACGEKKRSWDESQARRAVAKLGTKESG